MMTIRIIRKTRQNKTYNSFFIFNISFSIDFGILNKNEAKKKVPKHSNVHTHTQSIILRRQILPRQLAMIKTTNGPSYIICPL